MTGVAVVTGGAGTLGTAMCMALGGRGCQVVVAYHHRAQEAETLVKAIGPESAIAVRADLSQPDAAEILIGAAEERFGVVGILVNNAGIMTDSLVEDMTDGDWDTALTVNLTSSFRLIRRVIPGMRSAGGGRIINVSSQAAFRGSVGHAHYAAAKSGLLGLTYSLARELGRDSITVNAVVPGRFVSDMISAHVDGKAKEWLAATPLGRFGEPQELAGLIGFLASDEAAYITGSAMQVGGGLVMG